MQNLYILTLINFLLLVALWIITKINNKKKILKLQIEIENPVPFFPMAYTQQIIINTKQLKRNNHMLELLKKSLENDYYLGLHKLRVIKFLNKYNRTSCSFVSGGDLNFYRLKIEYIYNSLLSFKNKAKTDTFTFIFIQESENKFNIESYTRIS
jgi:hypothetical protein